MIPSLVGAIVLGSRSVKLHWTVSHSPEREIIDGFFIGYRSFADTPALIHAGADPQQQHKLATAQLSSVQSSGLNQPASIPLDAGGQTPTFTYKTVRLNHRASPSEQTDGLAHLARQQQQADELLDPNAAYISPLSSISKSIIRPSSNYNLQQQVISSSFEYLIEGLERNMEYSIFIQCFNKKGAGPRSDPVIFKTFANGKFASSRRYISPTTRNVVIIFLQKRLRQLINNTVIIYLQPKLNP